MKKCFVPFLFCSFFIHLPRPPIRLGLRKVFLRATMTDGMFGEATKGSERQRMSGALSEALNFGVRWKRGNWRPSMAEISEERGFRRQRFSKEKEAAGGLRVQ